MTVGASWCSCMNVDGPLWGSGHGSVHIERLSYEAPTTANSCQIQTTNTANSRIARHITQYNIVVSIFFSIIPI